VKEGLEGTANADPRPTLERTANADPRPTLERTANADLRPTLERTANGGAEAGRPLGAIQIAERVAALGAWFHNLDLDGVQTAPGHFLGDYPANKWQRFAAAIPSDLRGKTVLDVGCNGGFHAIEMKRRGADRVVGIDSDEGYLEQARFAAQVKRVDIELVRMSVYEVAALRERFDLVLFMGVLYHLRHPLLALDLLHEHAVGDTLVFQTMLRGSAGISGVLPDYPFSEEAVFEDPGFPRMSFVEQSYAGDPTNWWIPNLACAEAMLRSAGFRIELHPEPEVFICRPAGAADAAGAPGAREERA
jgi:tRNA (mo5U34)-methyltransferase